MFEEDTRAKVLFLSVVLCLVVALTYAGTSNDKKAGISHASQVNHSDEYVYGSLKKNTTWTDEFDDVYHMTALGNTYRVHRNDTPVKIEIRDLDIVTSDGKTNRNVVMIYFLEGRFKGRWGYTVRAYTES